LQKLGLCSLFVFAGGAISALNACGEATHAPLTSTESNASGGESERAGASHSGGNGGSAPSASSAGAGGSAGAGAGGSAEPVSSVPITKPLDTSNCAERKAASCENALTFYSGGDLSETPELAPCVQFASVDGCERAKFAFDAQGCANEVTTVPGVLEHLEPLRACLADALANTRWPCLASSVLTYDEGCFFR
jgi:hypothetical protein